ncbi:hypothetical protein [Rhodococcus sp. As11]|uniref:hypothetical protein n=1 Tax=Rhodococcus sp. As11 TaxID=3029189 RepID=UPI003B8045E1
MSAQPITPLVDDRHLGGRRRQSVMHEQQANPGLGWRLGAGVHSGYDSAHLRKSTLPAVPVGEGEDVRRIQSGGPAQRIELFDGSRGCEPPGEIETGPRGSRHRHPLALADLLLVHGVAVHPHPGRAAATPGPEQLRRSATVDPTAAGSSPCG